MPLRASTPLGVTPFAAAHRMYLAVCLLTRTRLRSVGLVGGVANSSCRNGGRGRSPRMFATSGARLCGLDFRFRRGVIGRPRAGDGGIREPPLVKWLSRHHCNDGATRAAPRARAPARLRLPRIYKGYERLSQSTQSRNPSLDGEFDPPPSPPVGRL